jgi:signal transduction histidine kinase
MKPISRIVSEVKEISHTRLNRRLKEGKGKDEIEQLAVTFNRMLSQLEQVFRSQDQFVSNASHELRTPLAVMMAESDYILNRESSREDLIAHISGINKDLQKLNHMITGLLELTWLEKGEAIRFTRIRGDELLLDAIQQIRGKFPDRKVKPTIEYSENENDLMIRGNQGLLLTVFLNLLENAFKFSTDDVSVKLALFAEGMTITISDQGIGIPEEEIQEIFKPFIRGSNVRHIPGSGIGLSIVYRIVQLHGGDLKITSSAGKGTAVELIFKNHPDSFQNS